MFLEGFVVVFFVHISHFSSNALVEIKALRQNWTGRLNFHKKFNQDKEDDFLRAEIGIKNCGVLRSHFAEMSCVSTLSPRLNARLFREWGVSGSPFEISFKRPTKNQAFSGIFKRCSNALHSPKPPSTQESQKICTSRTEVAG